MDRKRVIVESIGKGTSSSDVAMRMLVLSPTVAFEGCEDIGFSITESIAEFFSVSVRSVHVCGSAKLGFSPVKKTPFSRGESDLDVAIIDHDCFNRYVGEVIVATNQYRDRRGFARKHGAVGSTYDSFVECLAKGIFRPDMMPYCDARKSWMEFFRKLSLDHSSVFSKISAGIYLSDVAFRLKQSNVFADMGRKGFL